LEYTNPKLSHYGGTVVSPLVEKHPVTGVPVLRFLEATPSGRTILNPPAVRVRGVAEEREAELLAELSAAVRSPRSVYAHTWEEGDVVITDNYALLHTRESYARGLPRHLRRVHVLGDPALRSRVQHGRT
jgi:alpha-ketoglutarate-dependent taurine dioxygenase